MIIDALKRFPEKELFVAAVRKGTFETEMKCHGCAQVIVQTFLDTLGQENTELSMSASPFAAGMALTGNNCGALIGGLMVLGLFYGRKDVKDGMAGINFFVCKVPLPLEAPYSIEWFAPKVEGLEEAENLILTYYTKKKIAYGKDYESLLRHERKKEEAA